MANRATVIGRIMRSGDFALARIRIRRAVTKARGNLYASGRLLDVSPATIERLIVRLALEDYVAEVRGRHGWKVGGAVHSSEHRD